MSKLINKWKTSLFAAVVAVAATSLVVLIEHRNYGVFDIAGKGKISSNIKILFVVESHDGIKSSTVLSVKESSDLISRIRLDGVLTGDSLLYEDSRLQGVHGKIITIPSWLGHWPFAQIIPYVRGGVYAEYNPFKELLYISEDCSELWWDYSQGFCVSNISPSMLHFDMAMLPSWDFAGFGTPSEARLNMQTDRQPAAVRDPSATSKEKQTKN